MGGSRDKEDMEIEEFYAECSALLGTADAGEAFPYYRRTRWNNRKPGRGRFPGHGMIRAFGDVVHIHLHTPKPIQKVIEGRDAALEFLRAELA